MVKRIVLFLMAVLMVSCGVLRPPQGHESSHRDSTVINYRDSLCIRDSLRIRDSLVLVPLPVESSQNILPSFIPSHLETSLAQSDAWVDSLGLHHTLSNKKDSLGVHVPVTEHIKETEHTQSGELISEKEDHEKDTVYVEVEKPWKWYDRAALWLGRVCFCAFIIYFIFLFFHRKK